MSRPAGPGRIGLDARIAAHVHTWEKLKRSPAGAPERYPFITISRQFGCKALPTSQLLAERLNERYRPSFPWVVYDRELLDNVARELHLGRELVESLDDVRRKEMTELFDMLLNRKMDEALMFRKIAEVVWSLATHGHAVIVGRGGYLITQGLSTGLHVHLVAPRAWRISRLSEERGISQARAQKVVTEGEEERERFLRTFFLQDPARHFSHDLVIDSSRFEPHQIADIICGALTARFPEALVRA